MLKNSGLAFLTVFILAAICCWDLWEQDIFWVIRCGEEFLNLGNLHCQNQWALDANFNTWFNAYWFSEPILYLVHSAMGIKGLIFFRCLLVLMFLLGCCKYLMLLNKAKITFPLLGILAVIFTLSSFRFQVRADFLATSLAPLLFAIPWTALIPKMKIILTILLLIIAMNLHSGIGLILIGCSLVLNFELLKNKKYWLGIPLIGLTAFCTPGHIHVFELFNLVPTNTQNINNVEWEAFGLQLFFRPDSLASATAFSLNTLAFIFSVIYVVRKRLVSYYPFTILALGLLFLTLLKFRTAPFFALASLPAISLWLNSTKLSQRFSVAVGILLLPLFVFTQPYGYNFKVPDFIYPKGLFSFIGKNQPEGPILHEAATGNYMNQYLRDYKIFIDTRQAPFYHLQDKISLAGKSPHKMKNLIQEYDFKTILMPTIPVRFEGTKVIDYQNELFPKDKWATVQFNERFFLALKRIPDHQILIDNYEYKIIKSNHPAFIWEPTANERLSALKIEIDRCLESQKSNYLCQAHNLFWHFKKGLSSEGQKLYEEYLKSNGSIKSYLTDLLPLLEVKSLNSEVEFIGKLLHKPHQLK